MADTTALLRHLFESLNGKDHRAMAECYCEEANFRDIAFELTGKKQIHTMWALTCMKSNVRATFTILQTTDEMGEVDLVDDYVFRETNRPVHNVIKSHFQFRDGLILKHWDECNAKDWAAQALGGFKGFLAGRIALLRHIKAKRLLRDFVREHSEFQI